jgi:hypothetical protein
VAMKKKIRRDLKASLEKEEKAYPGPHARKQ